MGAYTPLPWAPADLNDRVMKTIINPVIAEMAKRGIPFQGLLYAGLALTADGPKVIEFNARFGDPETQPLLTLLESPLGQLLYAAAQGRLSSVEAPKFHKGAAIGIVVAADGYPEHNETGGRIPRRQFHTGQVKLFHSGTRRANDDNHLEIAAGRVMCAVARGSSLKFARNMAYATLNSLYLPGTFFRRDIGEKAVLGGDPGAAARGTRRRRRRERSQRPGQPVRLPPADPGDLVPGVQDRRRAEAVAGGAGRAARSRRRLRRDDPNAVIAAYERVVDQVELASIADRERITKHDVKARIEEFNALAGFEHVHKGMTSRDLTENVEQWQLRESLLVLREKTVAALVRMARRASEYADLAMAGRSHNVAAR